MEEEEEEEEVEDIADTAGHLGGVHTVEKEDKFHLKPCKEKAHPVQAPSHEGNECV